MDSKPSVSNQRWIILDVMKAICICMVIITHVGGIPNTIKAKFLWPFTILPAVPLFLMMSVFVFSLAEDKRNGTVLSWFEWKTFWKRLNRFLIPQAVAIAVIIAGLFIFRDLKWISASAVFRMFQMGGRGPGAYYVIVMYQLLILFPFIRMFFKKNQAATVLGMVLLNIAYETLCKSWGINDNLYNTLIFKYLAHLALGMLLYAYWDQLAGTAIPMVCILIGTIYLINVYYLKYRPVMIYGNLTRTIYAAPYAFGVLCYALRLEKPIQRLNLAGLLRPICYIGKASYHIMLTQMVYFYVARTLELEAKMGGLRNAMLIDLTVSLAVGCLFYACDNRARRLLNSTIEIIKRKR